MICVKLLVSLILSTCVIVYCTDVSPVLETFVNDEATLSSLFRQFVDGHGKSYASVGEREYRFNIFKENARKVATYNQLSQHAKYSIDGPFADLTEKEFQSKYLINSKRDLLAERAAMREESSALKDPIPTAFDWREKGVVTPVKNQESCGSCWAFSAAGNIEGQWALAGNPLISLSEQFLVDCDTNDCGCFGGYPHRAYEYILKHGGIPAEPTYPYCIPPVGNCHPCSTNTSYCPSPLYCNRTCLTDITGPSHLAAKISSWSAISKDENEIAVSLVNRGPLSVCLNAAWLQFYHHGISDPLICSPTELNHAVLLVGYGVEKTLFGHTPFWIIKNSWGVKWGESGYFRLYRGKGKCGIDQLVTTANVRV